MRASVLTFLLRLVPRRTVPAPQPLGNGSTPYTRDHPSLRYSQLIARYQSFHTRNKTMTGKHFLRAMPQITTLVCETAATSVLDYGCGKGFHFDNSLVQAFGSFAHCTFTGYDPGVIRFARLPSGPFDGVTCFEVLEHCPEEDLSWVLHEIGSLAQKFVLLSISCQPSQKTFPNGDPFHVTVQPPAWWKARLTEAFPPSLKLWVFFEEGNGRVLEVLNP